MAIAVIATFVHYLAETLLGAIFIRVILGWLLIIESFRWIDGSPLWRLLLDVTEPVLRPIRQVLPPAGGLDFSPMIAMVALYVIDVVVQTQFAAYS